MNVDPMYYVSDPNAVWNVPFYPAGSVDGKVTTSAAVKGSKGLKSLKSSNSWGTGGVNSLPWREASLVNSSVASLLQGCRNTGRVD